MTSREQQLERLVRELLKEVGTAYFEGCVVGRRFSESVGSMWIDAQWRESAHCRNVENIKRELEGQ